VARATLVYVQPVGTQSGPLPPHRGEILAAGDDGARPRALAHGFAPVVSPDGRLIAFLRYQGDRGDLWTMGVGGRHQRRVLRGVTLGPTGRQAYQPYTWSSDSRRLAKAAVRGPARVSPSGSCAVNAKSSGRARSASLAGVQRVGSC